MSPGWFNQQLLLKNEYLVAENRILRSHLPKRHGLSDEERSILAEMGWPEAAGSDCPGCQTRHHSCLVSQAGGQEVRRFQTSHLSRSAVGCTGGRQAGASDGHRESWLGFSRISDTNSLIRQ